MKKKKITDIIILLLIGYVIFIGIFTHFVDKYRLTLNFYLGVITWLIASYFTFFSRNEKKFLIMFLLVLGTLNIVVFSSILGSIETITYIYRGDNLIIAGPGINPLFLLLIFLYCLINPKLFVETYHTLRYGGEKEINSKFETGVNFYYNKFNSYSSEELKEVYKMYKEYPDEAKGALSKIHKERNLNYIEL